MRNVFFVIKCIFFVDKGKEKRYNDNIKTGKRPEANRGKEKKMTKSKLEEDTLFKVKCGEKFFDWFSQEFVESGCCTTLVGKKDFDLYEKHIKRAANGEKVEIVII